ncbi:MAG: hypothetical protein ABI665_27090, partial [Vicinamibacterales bacterium]
MIAAYYALFATMGGAQALPSELIAATVFVVVAVVGFCTQPVVRAHRHPVAPPRYPCARLSA